MANYLVYTFGLHRFGLANLTPVELMNVCVYLSIIYVCMNLPSVHLYLVSIDVADYLKLLSIYSLTASHSYQSFKHCSFI